MNDSANTLDSDTQAATKKSSKALWITLILLLAISGGAYYLWHLLNTTIAQQQNQLLNLQQQLSRTQDIVQQHDKQIIMAAKHSQNLQDMAQQAIELGTRHQKGWMLAEADYLIRIANRRLQISHDINGAIAALQGADQALNEIGDLSLLPVRRQITRDLAALKALRQVDIDGISLALDQMSDHVAGLPFKSRDDEIKQQTESTTDAAQATNQEKGLTDKLIDTIMSIGDIKIYHHTLQPVSDEQKRFQAEYTLLSHLASARLAALRFDAKQFAYDINVAQQTLTRNYDTKDNRVAQMLKDLAGFATVELAPVLPDITASWRSLQTARSKISEVTK